MGEISLLDNLSMQVSNRAKLNTKSRPLFVPSALKEESPYILKFPSS